MATITLQSVNDIPRKTWNYLKINDTSVKVDAPVSTESHVAKELADTTMGCGVEATNYIDALTDGKIEELKVTDGAQETISIKLDAYLPQKSTVIRVGKKAQLTLMLTCITDASCTTTLAHNLRIFADNEADVRLLSLISSQAKPVYLENIGVVLGNHANFEAQHFALHNQNAHLGVAMTLKGESATFNTKLRYLAQGREKLDVNYIADLFGLNGQGDIVCSGVLLENARKRVAMTVDLKKGCKGSGATENETALVFGDGVRNQTIPIILCHEDEVSAAHGATIGSINTEQLGYLKSRGLVEEEIVSLFSNAVIEDALNQFPVDSEAYRHLIHYATE